MPAKNKTDGEAEILAAIAEMPEEDRIMGERLHTIIKTSAPSISFRTWYGMPAYTDGNKIICFFRSRKKFAERYMTFGFNDVAKLDDGNMWPITFALTNLTDVEETKISELIQKAVG